MISTEQLKAKISKLETELSVTKKALDLAEKTNDTVSKAYYTPLASHLNSSGLEANQQANMHSSSRSAWEELQASLPYLSDEKRISSRPYRSARTIKTTTVLDGNPIIKNSW